jgi:hypothetical protein
MGHHQESAMYMTRKALLGPALLAAALLVGASDAVATTPLYFVASEAKADLKALEGKRVLGKSGELLGHIGKVNEQARMAELKTTSGAIVSIPTDLLVEDGNRLSAPLSRGDIIAMIDRPGAEPTIREAGSAPSP